MKAEITENGEDELYNSIEFPLAQVLADMTRTGILVDREGIEAFGVQLRQELDQVLTRIEMEAGTSDFNPNSTKQLGTLLFDTMGLRHGKKTKNGWSTDAETLEKLRDIPLVEDILQYRACQKLNSTYVEGLLKVIGEDGRIHTRFNQTEARTGRLSSDNPNLQNIPIRTEWAASSAPTLWQSPAACWWMPITARSNCASWPMSPATHTCRRRSSPVPTSTAAPQPRSTTSGLRMSRPACAPAPRPSTLASCTEGSVLSGQGPRHFGQGGRYFLENVSEYLPESGRLHAELH